MIHFIIVSLYDTFRFNTSQMLLNEQPFQLICGEMHPSRIPYPDWERRVKMAKALGINTVQVVQVNGAFDFEKQNNISDFLYLLQKYGLYAVIRPGPYSGAEWDLGGIPFFMLKENANFRSLDEHFIQQSALYIEAVAVHLRGNFVSQGGNIILLQLEEQYALQSNVDNLYLQKLQQLWLAQNVSVDFYLSDYSYKLNMEAHLPGAAIGIIGQANEKDLELARLVDPNVPVILTKIQTGDCAVWGQDVVKTNDIADYISEIMAKGWNFNIQYLVGGTNFGTTAGRKGSDYLAMQYTTSHNCGALVDESGNPTLQFMAIRELLLKNVSEKPDFPLPLETIEFNETKVIRQCTFFDVQVEYISSNGSGVSSFEELGYNQGIIIYRTLLENDSFGLLDMKFLSDYSVIYVSGDLIDGFEEIVSQQNNNFIVKIPKVTGWNDSRNWLEIVIEGMGHESQEHMEKDLKGMVSPVTFQNKEILDWEYAYLNITPDLLNNLPVMNKNNIDRRGGFYTTAIQLQQVGEVWISLKGFYKGALYVNGANVGNYWNDGQQSRLFVPSSYLKVGNNQLVIVDNWVDDARNLGVQGYKIYQ